MRGRLRGLHRSARWLAAAAAGLWLSSAAAQTTKPPPHLEYWPEVDVYFHHTDQLRSVVQLSPVFNPSARYSEMTFGVFVDWFTSPLLRRALTNDESRKHLLSVRLGAEYTQTLERGSAADVTKTLMMEGAVEARFHLPLDLLLSIRERMDGQRKLAGSPGLELRDRLRGQLEREFQVGEGAITPYGNAEMFWGMPGPRELRVKTGVVFDVKRLARGQALELYYLRELTLQSGASDVNVLALVLHLFF